MRGSYQRATLLSGSRVTLAPATRKRAHIPVYARANSGNFLSEFSFIASTIPRLVLKKVCGASRAEHPPRESRETPKKEKAERRGTEKKRRKELDGLRITD